MREVLRYRELGVPTGVWDIVDPECPEECAIRECLTGKVGAYFACLQDRHMQDDSVT